MNISKTNSWLLKTFGTLKYKEHYANKTRINKRTNTQDVRVQRTKNKILR